MNTSRRITAISAAIGVAAMGLALVPRQTASGAQQGAEQTPAYHSQVPSGPLPQTMDPASFDDPAVKNAYAAAAKVKRVLYQQPCYCHCDRSVGHESLLDCYAIKHASVCGVCMREAFYAYEQAQQKKTPAEIRDGIERGEWQQVDVSKYQTYPAK